MKRLGILTLVLITLVGCTPKAYTENYDQGVKQALEGEYEESLKSFRKASKEKETDDVSNMIEIVLLLNDSKTSFENGDFEASKFSSEKVKTVKFENETTKKLEQAAKDYIKQSDEALIQLKSMNDTLVKGKTFLEQQKFDEAYKTFELVATTKAPFEHNSFTTEINNALDLKKKTIDSKEKYKQEQEAKRQAELKKKQEEQRKLAEEKKKQEAEQQASANEKQRGVNGEVASSEQAEQIVADYLGVKPKPNFFIEFDHMEGNDYIVQVYEVVVDDAENAHSATYGWYGVVKESGLVYDFMAR